MGIFKVAFILWLEWVSEFQDWCFVVDRCSFKNWSLWMVMTSAGGVSSPLTPLSFNTILHFISNHRWRDIPSSWINYSWQSNTSTRCGFLISRDSHYTQTPGDTFTHLCGPDVYWFFKPCGEAVGQLGLSVCPLQIFTPGQSPQNLSPLPRWSRSR